MASLMVLARVAVWPSSKLRPNSKATSQARLQRIACPRRCLRKGAVSLPQDVLVGMTGYRQRPLSSAAGLGNRVVITAFEIDPIRNQVFRSRQIGRPRSTRHQIFGLPHHIELAVRPDLADEDRFGDVVIGQDRKSTRL